MSAPSNATGGNGRRAVDAPGRKTRGSRRSRSASRRSKPPRYDTTRSSRPRILAVAAKKADELGYERLKLSDITEAAEISHQGFYIHFKNKRHAVAVATSEQLGAVAELVNRPAKGEEAWAKRLEDEIDKALAERYPSEDGPESRLREKLIEVIEQGAFARTRIEELVKASGVGHAEFYRRYGGKRGCLQRIYGIALAEVETDISAGPALLALAESLAADPRRATLLVIGRSYLPGGPEPEPGVSTQESLLDLIAGLAAGGRFGSFPADVAPGAALEVIRSSVIAAETKALPRFFGELRPTPGALVGVPSAA